MRASTSGLLGLVCFTLTALPSCAAGQQENQGPLPDAPGYVTLTAGSGASSFKPESRDPQQQPTAQAPTQAADGSPPQQTKRILGIIPNFRSVNVDQKLPPMSVKEKFVEATQDCFDYSSIALPALVAVYDLETNATPQFGHGGVGYGRYLWHSVIDQTSENYFVEFIVPVVTHEDPRYYTLGKGGIGKRTWYSLTRVLITRKDDGGKEFNASEILGAGMSAGLSNLYYPSQSRTFGNTASQWGTDIGIDALSLMVKEFWPDINQRLFHGKDE